MKQELQEIDKELLDLTEKINRKKKAKDHLANLEMNIIETENRILELEKIVEKESNDVEKLNKLSIKNLFISILGDKDKLYEVERQEYLMSVLNYNGLIKEVESLKFERDIIKRKLSEEFNLEKRFNFLINSKESILKVLGSESSKKLIEIEFKLTSHKEMVREFSEAIEKGKECEEVLKRLEIGLRRARKWGHWYYSGTRHVSESIQKDYIKEASGDLYQANNLLQQFQRELLDVYDHFKIDYRSIVEDFTDFLEVFYDRLITDWLVIQKIDSSLNEVHNYTNKIKRIIFMLEGEKKEVENFIADEENMKLELLLNTK